MRLVPGGIWNGSRKCWRKHDREGVAIYKQVAAMPLLLLINMYDHLMKQSTFEKATFSKVHTKSVVNVIVDDGQHHKPSYSSLKWTQQPMHVVHRNMSKGSTPLLKPR